MKEKKYGLTKQETDRLNKLLNVASLQEEMFQAIQERYRLYLVSEVFKRLSIKPELLKNSTVDLAKGQLIIKVPEKEKNASNSDGTKKK